MERKVGDKIGKSYLLQTKIDNMFLLCNTLDKSSVIYWRHKVYPTAFIKNWSYAILKRNVELGYLWCVIKTYKQQF